MVTLERTRKDAPWAWLKAGFADMMSAPVISIGYGAAFTLAGVLITVGLWSIGQAAMTPVLAGGFALVAPAFAVGIYRINQVREEGKTPGLLDFWSLPAGRIGQLALLSVLLLVFFLTWARLAQFLYAAFTVGNSMPAGEFTQFLFTDPAGLTLLVVGTAIGAVLAFVTFAVSALAFPMLTDQDVDAVTAVVASVKAVLQQPFTMLTWAWLIAFFVAVGSALFFVGLALAFPWLAHASWRAYRDFDPKPEPSASAVRG
ncbi:DUF2189 domain-containing protein [Marinicauda algicola]|uniref:DUF2189 domain-containing protein n=1 Tax=Marinicauda algicola TaxID=2029849 RepID=A0A4S2H4K0_9PROT|nr:DUF2189 domain-containing protein [Marinicauda algicola]TGY90580.1 DUF2189 domain-containing protein [Marinicauda algicola]